MSRSAQPMAAAMATIVLIYALAIESEYHSPRWPLSVSVAVLGLGLIVGRLVQRSSRQAVHTVAAIAALLVIIWLLSSGDFFMPRWPLQLTAVLLGLGIAADPFAQLACGHMERGFVQVLTAVAALLVLIWTLSTEPYLLPRILANDPYHSPTWPLSIAAVLLGLGLLAGPLAWLVGRQAAVRSEHSIAALLALLVLFWALTAEQYLSPRWPVVLTAMFLGIGLAAGPLGRFAGRPSVRMLSDRVDELSRTRRGALDVQASELRRIERDLHDGAQARLVALSMKLGRAEDRYRDDAETAALLREAREDATAAIRELRELARGIAPPVLTDRGLEAAVRSLAQRSGAEVTVSGELHRRPVPAVETAAYFVVAESLTNAAKHAPGARVEIRLDERGGDLFVEVTDFGSGGVDPAGGLIGLRQRVEAFDGALHVTSPAGVGTQVEAVLPCGW